MAAEGPTVTTARDGSRRGWSETAGRRNREGARFPFVAVDMIPDVSGLSRGDGRGSAGPSYREGGEVEAG